MLRKKKIIKNYDPNKKIAKFVDKSERKCAKRNYIN